MPLFDRENYWRRIGTTMVVELLIVLGLALAVVSYVEWSSSVALDQFIRTSDSSSDESLAQTPSVKGRTGCPLGKISPPTQLMP
jgi:hypothetical protein